ncbi:MAG: HNH endonuclease [Chloroflexi bacterium]|nr:HNH endonuclease [Chloroflexota bacterium]
MHHIIPESQNGASTIDNAIVLCLRCHGEVGHYNNEHPVGNKYSASELTKRRDAWWTWCEDNPAVPLPKNPVSVSPSRIDLGNDEWLTKSLLHIYNKEDRFYYQVWVKIGIESEEIQPEQISIDFVRGHDDLKLRAGFVEMSASIFRVCCVDGAGKKVAFLVINSLEPHSIYTFEISRLPSCKLSSTKAHKLQIAISSFRDEPAGSGEGANEAFLTFIPPENLQMTAISLVMRRTTK